MRTDGRSQNPAIKFSRQNPGHLGNGGPAGVVVVAGVGRDAGGLDAVAGRDGGCGGGG